MSSDYDEQVEDECICFAANILRIVDNPTTDIMIEGLDFERIRTISRYLSDDAREKLELTMEDIIEEGLTDGYKRCDLSTID